MRIPEPIRRHRVLAAFAAGALLSIIVAGVVAYWVVADQRRSAQVLGAALSHALSREVRIERVTDLGTQRLVLSGVRLPKSGGWPADVAAERVEATGPLLAAARGDAAPVTLVVTHPTVSVGGGWSSSGLSALDGLHEALASFLGTGPLLDVTLTGAFLRDADGVVPLTADLTLRKGRGEARVEASLRGVDGPPLTITADARLEGQTARVAVTGRGPLLPVARWLPGDSAQALVGQSLDLRLDAELASPALLSARARITAGAAIDAGGEVTVKDRVLQVSRGRLAVDLAVAAAVLALPWRPTGHIELGDVAGHWQPDREARPTVSGTLSVPAAALPAAAVGTEVTLERLDGRVIVEPAGEGFAARGEVGAARIRAGGVDVIPMAARVRARLDARGALLGVDLEGLAATVAGAALTGSVAYDGARRRVDAGLGGETVELAALVRQIAPGWLDATDRLRTSDLHVRLGGLDPVGLRAGSVEVTARNLLWSRPDGRLGTGMTVVRGTFGKEGMSVTLDTADVEAKLPAVDGAVPAVKVAADLARPAAGGIEPRGATLSARDRTGREIAHAEVAPAAGAAPGALRFTAQAPALDRLDGLWPQIDRRLTGSLALDVLLVGPGYRSADGRLSLTLADAELLGKRIFVRDARADLPVRRGPAATGEPPWGRIEVGEAIGYGVVIQDLTTPARMWNDRLSLNDLAYALYSGIGKGWAELDIEPAGLRVRANVTGEGVRVEEFIGASGIRGATMTGLLSYDVGGEYRAGRLAVNGRFAIPAGGVVSIELLDRLLRYADTDPSGVVRSALANLRNFEYKHAEASARTVEDEVLVSLALQGRERFGIFPPRVREINVRSVPLSFLARQVTGH